MFGVSIDSLEEARKLARQLGLTFPLLSDPGMQIIRQYEMKGEGMEMADMGYVIIDREGRIRARRIDRQFGDRMELLLHDVRQAKA